MTIYHDKAACAFALQTMFVLSAEEIFKIVDTFGHLIYDADTSDAPAIEAIASEMYKQYNNSGY